VPLFFNIDFCLQLLWIVVHKLCNIACNFEREKTMLATNFLFRDGADVITYLTLFFELSFKFKLSFMDFTKNV
jgi:hypothetical protein